MGCSPSKSEPNIRSPISVVGQPTESAPLTEYPSYHRPSSRKKTRKQFTRSARGQTLNPNSRRYSVSPVEVNDFWGTMPLSVIIDRLNSYYEEMNRSKGNVHESISFIQEILFDLSQNFESSQYRTLKKSNSKFKQLIGNYGQGVLFLKTLGFREKGEVLRIDDALTINNMKHKVKEFEFALKKIKGNVLKGFNGTQ